MTGMVEYHRHLYEYVLRAAWKLRHSDRVGCRLLLDRARTLRPLAIDSQLQLGSS